MRDDPSVVDLVRRARDGDKGAWDEIVERYATLVWGVCRRYGLSGPDADDVGGAVWLRLVENLGTIREPAALAGWLATTTRRECLLLLRSKKRSVPIEDLEVTDSGSPAADEWLLVEEQRHALRMAFAELSARCRQLLSILFEDPPPAYTEISATLAMPVGAIGPNRKRCLDRLRGSRSLDDLRPAAPAGIGHG